MKANENWTSQLEGQSIDQQIAALQAIAQTRGAEGFTIAVVRLTSSPNDEVRSWAAEALEVGVKPTLDEAESLIAELRKAEDGERCYWAATLLGRLGDELASRHDIAGDAVLALEGCLRDSRYLPARERAARGLCQLGAASKSALPTLRRLAVEAPPRLQRLSSEAAKAIDAAA